MHFQVVDALHIVIYHLEVSKSSEFYPEKISAAFSSDFVKKMKDTIEQPDNSVLKHGYLLKQSEVLKQWHLRYFVLSKECLCYYRSEQEAREDQSAPKELIFFNDMSLYIDELPDKQTKYCLKIVKRSLSPKVPTRTVLLCCFCEHERNEWLSQILHAKAFDLVVDPTAWIGNEDSSVDDVFDMNHEQESSVRADKLATAKEVFRKCRRKLSLGANPRGDSAPSSLFPDDSNLYKRRKSLTVDPEWRKALMAI